MASGRSTPTPSGGGRRSASGKGPGGPSGKGSGGNRGGNRPTGSGPNRGGGNRNGGGGNRGKNPVGGGRRKQPTIRHRQVPWLAIGAVAVVVVLVAVIGYFLFRTNSDVTARDGALAPFRPTSENRDPSTQIPGVDIRQYEAQLHVESPRRISYDHYPPSGGPHDFVWAACTGTVYNQPVRDENMVHSLEHGAVWIAYDPARISGPALQSLEAKVQGQSYMMISPYPGLDQPISLQSWGHQLKLADPADPRIDQFVAALRTNPNTHPEVGASCDAYPGLFDPESPPPFDPSPRGPDAGRMDGSNIQQTSGELMTATDADRRATADDLDPVDPPFDEGDGGDDEGPGGWWSSSPTWAKAVLAGGVALVLLLVGALVGGLVARDSVTTYGPSADAIDTAFLQDMSVHHRQAVQMAVLERERTADPRLAQLAFDMESSQTMQVGMMEGWLRLWDQPISPPEGVHMAWMGMPSTSMPGMATEQELGELRTLSGTALDVRFLQLMLRHHEGGFPMLSAASGQADVPAVGTLADAMLRAQSSEAQTMRAMLAERGAAPLPTPTHGAMGGMDHGGMPMN